jgi:Na+-translocating ferredoxin:NAD+ oxidoreductase RnfG subunit
MDGVLFADHVMGKHEVIDYVVAITLEGAVRQIEVLEYRESHGGEIRGAKWRAQFRGKTSNSGLKLNKDIYNISGATMSCRHVTEGVKRVLATFEVVVRPTLPARGGVQHSASTRD